MEPDKSQSSEEIDIEHNKDLFNIVKCCIFVLVFSP